MKGELPSHVWQAWDKEFKNQIFFFVPCSCHVDQFTFHIYYIFLSRRIAGRRGFESCSGHKFFLHFKRRVSKVTGKLFTSFSLFLRLSWFKSFIFCLLPWFVGEEPWYTQMSRKKDVPWIGLVLFTHINKVATHPVWWPDGVVNITPNQYCGETRVGILLGTLIFLSFQETCDESHW